MITKQLTSKNKQTGVVLVVSLIMLLLLTLIGVTGTQVTTLEEKMAGNSRDQNVAFQAAEATLVEAETFILTQLSTGDATYNVGGGLLSSTQAEPADFFLAATWTGTNSVVTSDGFRDYFVNNSGLTIANPRYIIKRIGVIGSSPVRTAFRITARAQGISPGTQIILQEIFERTN